MSRNSSGTHSLPNAPVVPDTAIEADWANTTMDDLSAEITDSLSRSGKGGMTAHMRGVDGSSAIPAYSFTNQTTLGPYRAGSGDYRIAFNGTDIAKFTTSEVRFYNATKISSGGLTVDAGGVTVTAGGATITAGGLSVVAGGLTAAGSTPSNGTVAGANTLSVADALSTTSGHSQPLTTTAKALAVGNTVRLNVRTNNTGAVSGWDQVDLGLSYDVDTSVAAGGSLYLGKNGATLTSGTAASGGTPANALTLANGNLKLSGTAPNKDVALSNTLTPANICKAWAYFTITGGNGLGNFTTTFGDGLGITSISRQNNTTIRVTFATAFAAATYSPVLDTQLVTTTKAVVKAGRTTTIMDIEIQTVSTGVAIDLDASGSQWELNLHIKGRQ